MNYNNEITLNQSPVDNLNLWSDFLAQGLKSSFYVVKLSKCYAFNKFGMGKLSSLEVLRKTAELVKAIHFSEDGAFQEKLQNSLNPLNKCLSSLNEKIELRYYSGILGTARKILSYVGLFRFTNTQHALEIKALRAAIATLTQEIDPKLIEQFHNEELKKKEDLKTKEKEEQAQLLTDIDIRRKYLRKHNPYIVEFASIQDEAYRKQLDQRIEDLWEILNIYEEDLGFPPVSENLWPTNTLQKGLLAARGDLPEVFKDAYLKRVQQAVNDFLSTHVYLSLDTVDQKVLEEKWKTYGPEIEAIFKEAYSRIMVRPLTVQPEQTIIQVESETKPSEAPILPPEAPQVDLLSQVLQAAAKNKQEKTHQSSLDSGWQGLYRPQVLSENKLTKPLKPLSAASKSARKELQEFVHKYELAFKLDKEKEIVGFYEKLKEANPSYTSVYADFLENKSSRAISLAAYLINIQKMYAIDAQQSIEAPQVVLDFIKINNKDFL